ncbi:MAG TPA: hypothetical protein VIL65_00630 [Beijerinckiaceae bacterium]|jgi:hypothetical protein
MVAIVKIAGLSAALSAGVVTAYDRAPVQPGDAPAKRYVERIAPEPETAPIRFASAAADACSLQAWPNIAPSCVEGTRRPVRQITIEAKRTETGSVLVRLPAEMARR